MGRALLHIQLYWNSLVHSFCEFVLLVSNSFYCKIFLQLISCSKDPSKSNRIINVTERIYLQKEIGALRRKKNLPSTLFKAILTSLPAWAIIISQNGMDFSNYVIATKYNIRMQSISNNFVLNFRISICRV